MITIREMQFDDLDQVMAIFLFPGRSMDSFPFYSEKMPGFWLLKKRIKS